MITTVIFDLDDTLFDEIDYCRSGFKTVSQFLADKPQIPPADTVFKVIWRQFSAGNHTKTFNTALDELGLNYNDKLIAELIKVYREHQPKITLPADSKEVLEKLSGKYKLGLITDGFLPAQRLKVQALDVEKYFQCIVYTEELGREFWKPSPAGFEKIIQTLNAEPENVAFIGDNEVKDFITPNKLDFLTIKLIRSAGLHKKLCENPEQKAKIEIHEIMELPKLLEIY
jgi:putative hydrolase of the HAD superfamily